MTLFSRSVQIPWAACISALLGLAWCGYVLFPTTDGASCVTSGCALFRDTRIMGISPWWMGGAYFFVLSLLCIRGQQMLAWLLARMALAADALFLLVMLFTAPCFDCLVAAVFIALPVFFLRTSPAVAVDPQRPVRLLILPIWFGLFLTNALLAYSETVPLWNIGNQENTTVRLYFSPSCPACREALVTLGGSVALYPVEENDEDFASVLRLEALLKAGVPMQEAVRRCRDANEPIPEVSVMRKWALSFQLVRAKALIMRQGFDSLPLIEINGLPKSWVGARAETATPAQADTSTVSPQTAQAVDLNSTAKSNATSVEQGSGAPAPVRVNSVSGNQPAAGGAMPWELNDIGQCSQTTPEPCEDDQQ